MIFKRKIYDVLLKWKKEENGSSAMMIKGARCVGKTTIAEEFAKNEYKSHILINFAKEGDDVRSLFKAYMSDLDTLFMYLSNMYHVTLHKRESVIIFDEVQEFPRARECIKFLVEDGRYDYIETGSLISIRENVRGIVIPSEEDSVCMYPMDFEEFCQALGEERMIDYISDCFGKQTPLIKQFHDRSMLLFREYMLVGGMPQAVSTFIDSQKNLSLVDKQKRRILNLYRDDILKIGSSYKLKVAGMFDKIPSFLSKHEKRVIFSEIGKGLSADDCEDAIFWLSDSMICNVCFNCNDPESGLSRNEDRTFVKCYMGDTGLLISLAFSEKELEKNDLYNQILHDKLSINKGMLYENLVAQMLTSSGFPLYFYTHYNAEKHRNDIEVDFLIPESGTLNRKISPIEVKSTKRYTTTPLESFKEKFGKRMVRGIVIHPGAFRKDADTLYIPPYMTFCL
ncbi:MAG: AAA family ATPase [Clostridia bacterium]|nr:AAA family ATPase [Clostridia bacterium]